MQRILISGASSGIGAATALHLDRAGMDVIAGVRSLDDGERALAGASQRLRAVQLDVTDPASIADAVSIAGDRLDGLVNNAGIGVPGPLELIAVEDLREQLEVNVVGQVALTQAALPLLRPASGRIVFVGSVGGRLASQFAGPYHASKFAIEAIADAWRQELEPDSLTVSLIEPTAISTSIWERAIERLDTLAAGNDPRLARYRDRLAAFRETLQGADEHGKAPEDAADAIEHALTDSKPDTRYVVGASGRIATALRPLLPDRVADKLAQRTAAP